MVRQRKNQALVFQSPSKVWTELESSAMLKRGDRRVTGMTAKKLSGAYHDKGQGHRVAETMW